MGGEYWQTNPVEKLEIVSIWMEHQPKLNEKYTPSLRCMSSFEGTLYSNL